MPRKPSPLPEVAVLQSTFVLKDGRLINKFSRTARKAGCFADASNSRGYRTVYVAGKLRLAHRVIWKMTHGEDPKLFLDHINGDIRDNRPENLREVSHTQNMFNKKTYKSSSTGIKGVHHRKDNGMWRAYVVADGKRLNIGQFPTKEEAQAALNPIRAELHGEYARAA